MRFPGGKRREEFEDMAKKDEYIEEAYDELNKLSLAEQKRLEYELREKAMTQKEIAEILELEPEPVKELADEWVGE